MTAVTTTAQTVQPMPELSPEQYDALRADILAHGVRVPVTLDQYGRVLDGNNRMRIAAELGIEVPTTTIEVADDIEAHTVALTLNCARRHLTTAQKRDLIRAELARDAGRSDRAIARMIGCSPSTVGAERRGPVSKLDTWQPPVDVDAAVKDAVLRIYGSTNLTPELPTTDELDAWCTSVIHQDADDTLALSLLLASDVERALIATGIIGRMALWKARGVDRALIRRLFEPWLDMALSESTRQHAREHNLFGLLGEVIDTPDLIDDCLQWLGSVPKMPVAGDSR